MKQIFTPLLFALLLFILPGTVHAVATWDGYYTVSDYQQSCEPPIDLQSGFTVTDNQMDNLYGSDGDIAADGKGRMDMYYGDEGIVHLAYAFAEAGGKNLVNVNWSSTSSSPEYHPNGCWGTFQATANSFNFAFNFGNFGDNNIFVMPIIFFTVLCGGILFLIIIIKIIVRIAAPAAPAPEVVPAAQPVPREAQVAPAEEPQPQPAVQPENPQSRKKRPVYGKLQIPKKGTRIWPELPKKRL